MKKIRKILLGGYFIFTLVMMTSCSSEKSAKSTLDNDKLDQSVELQNGSHLTLDVMDNLKIDAKVENPEVEQCSVYKTIGKEFNKDDVMKLLLSDSESATTETNENTGISIIKTQNGEELTIGPGLLTYASDASMWDAYGLINDVYYNEISHMNDDKESNSSEENKMSKKTLKTLESLYPLGEDEKLELLTCVAVDKEKIASAQNDNQQLQGDIESGQSNEVNTDISLDNAYLLSFTVLKNDIPLLSTKEPDIMKQDDTAITQRCSIQVVLNDSKIVFIRMNGILEMEEKSKSDIITVNKGIEAIKSKYETQILTEECVIDQIWLEYVFVHNKKTEDLTDGTLEPYWCYQMKVTDSDNETDYRADRISAISGEDFEYE